MDFSGGSALYSPKYFMDHNVVVVSMNYRLGPLGFLNTGESIVRYMCVIKCLLC